MHLKLLERQNICLSFLKGYVKIKYSRSMFLVDQFQPIRAALSIE